MNGRKILILGTILSIGIAVFYSAVVIGQSGPSMPGTVIHHVTLKWKEGVSEADKQKAMEGLKEIVATSPGARNLWIKSVKVQPDEYHQAFVIEFENAEALKAYAKHPKKKAWDDFYYNIRETSYNCVTTN